MDSDPWFSLPVHWNYLRPVWQTLVRVDHDLKSYLGVTIRKQNSAKRYCNFLTPHPNHDPGPILRRPQAHLCMIIYDIILLRFCSEEVFSFIRRGKERERERGKRKKEGDGQCGGANAEKCVCTPCPGTSRGGGASILHGTTGETKREPLEVYCNTFTIMAIYLRV